MPQQTVLKCDTFQWLDVVDPPREELEALARQHGLHPALVQDCLDPEHLPKHERAGELSFLVLRAYDEAAAPEADTVQELTRKVAVFLSATFLITIHRKDQPYLAQVRERWKQRASEPDLGGKVFVDLFRSVLGTYEGPIDRALDEFERLEMGVFGAPGSRPFEIREGYYLKRKAFVFKRMIRISMDLLPRLTSGFAIDARELQDLREGTEHLYFYSDELIESVNSLLGLHISLDSQRTNEASHRINEVVRVLTVFSVFLLPLNLLTGIYGMNFEHMPELKWRYGYPMVLAGMVLVTLSVYLWFRRRGWLR